MMSDRSPGDPLTPAHLSGVQEALPTDNLFVLSHRMNVGAGSYAMNTPVVLVIPVQHATYKSTDVPFTPMSADYKP